MEKSQIIEKLKVVRRRLWVEKSIEVFQRTFFIGAVFISLEVFISYFFVIPFLFQKIGVTISLLLLGSIGFCLFKKPKLEDAAKRFDQNGLDDHVQTALQFWDRDSQIVFIQRKETLAKMKEHFPEVIKKKRLKFQKKAVLSAVLLLLVSASMYVIPYETKDLAVKEEAEKELLKETKKDLKEYVEDKEDELNNHDLKKLIQQLKERALVTSTSEEMLKELLEAEKRLYQKFQDSNQTQQDLKQLINGQPELNAVMEALDQNDQTAFNEAWNELLKKSQADSSITQLLKQLEELSNQNFGGDTTLEQFENAIQNLDQQSLEALSTQKDLNTMMNSLQQQMYTAGLSNSFPTAIGMTNSPSQNMSNSNTPSSQGTSSSNTNGNSNSQGGTPSRNSSQNGNSPSNQSGNGSGNGSAGSGSGQGQGRSGNGSGIGGGQTGAGGQGAGVGTGSRDLTIPETIGGRVNQQVDLGELTEQGENSQSWAPNGPTTPGQVRDYEEVLGDYESLLRQSMDRQELPESLEETVQNYFTELR